MRLIIIDLVPAVLEWKDGDTEISPGAAATLEQLYPRFRIAGVTDADRPGSEIRRQLEEAGLAGYFETVSTSADFGPTVSPQVVIRIGTTVGAGSGALFVTARSRIAEALGKRAVATLLLGPEGIAGLPEQLRMDAGPLNP